ncbi:hypothetical protein BHM03_00043347 [Ensete ventricosum]|nr:hypothetical protein BHM03_00043347 [Ensete ventricosum]
MRCRDTLIPCSHALDVEAYIEQTKGRRSSSSSGCVGCRRGLQRFQHRDRSIGFNNCTSCHVGLVRRRKHSVGRRLRTAHTADLTQVRSAPPTCKHTPHCKDSKHGGRVRRHDKP